MLLELENLLRAQVVARPPDMGQTVLVNSGKSNAEELLQRIKGVWQAVASWGRWCDEELGEWPSQQRLLASLPDYFTSAIRSVPSFEIENWLQDLHDREWIWWADAVQGGVVRIDLNADAMPASFWMLDFVIEALGAEVVYRGEWNER